MPTANSNNGKLQTKLDRAIQLNRLGKRAQAEQMLKALSRDHPGSASVWGYLGSVLLEAGRPEDSARSFARAVKLNPKSELASLGLFHSLWDQGLSSPAFAEMRRFLSLMDSVEYTTLLKDLAIEGRLVAFPLTAGAA